jgi:tetratricopeptide (TPR) repeat protein
MVMSVRRFLLPAILSLLIASAWMRASLYSDELDIWKDAAEKSPNKARPRNNYGHALKEAHRLDEALREFEQAVLLDPDYTDALNNLATVYGSIGRKTEALALLQKTLTLDPGHLQAKYNLAINYYEMGMYPDSVREYEDIIAIAPDSKEAAFGRIMLNVIRKQLLK